MGFLRKFGRSSDSDSSQDERLWQGFGTRSATGLFISQQTALEATPLYACVMMLSEDVAKLTPQLFRRRQDGGRDLVTDHWLAKLLNRPNDWQTKFNFIQMLMVQFLLRENAYAVICRTRGGQPYKLIPVNSDRVAVWEALTGELFYRVTPLGLHEMAELAGQPFLIPAEDILHIRGLSINGLLGSARIVLHREAIGIAVAQEQQQAHWLGNAAASDGVLQTDKNLTDGTAERLSKDWRDKHSGLQNSGKIIILEQGLKYQKLGLSATDIDFINGRKYQLEDLGRLFRIPPHMLGAIQGRSAEGVVSQQASEYLNFTLTGHTQRFREAFHFAFDIDGVTLFIDWDYSILTRADQATRYGNYQKMITGGFGVPNEARIDDGKNPLPNGDKLWMPSNVAYAGSQASGTLPDGGGRPEGSENEDEMP
jgi:HK97 family phage portal protein